jgi:SAM-dependent methyltransferase
MTLTAPGITFQDRARGDLVRCPVCRSEAPEAHLFSVNASQAAQHFVIREGDVARHNQLRDHIGILWGRDTCEVRTCRECEFRFAWPHIAGDGEFYNLAYPHVDYPRSKWEFTKTANALNKLVTKNRRVLEIGSGFGYFLDLVCPRLFSYANVVAIEYNAEAGQKLSDRGYSVVQQDVREQEFLKFKQCFDFVFMFQVLEHMDSPDVLFGRLELVTNEHAHVFIAVPNPKRIAFNEQHGSLLDMPPNHIGRWTAKTFSAICSNHGFDVLELDEEKFSLFAFIRQDLMYSYLRRAQRSKSLANRLRSRPKNALRKAAEAALALLYAPTRFFVWSNAFRECDHLGGSLWVHLRRR